MKTECSDEYLRLSKKISQFFVPTIISHIKLTNQNCDLKAFKVMHAVVKDILRNIDLLSCVQRRYIDDLLCDISAYHMKYQTIAIQSGASDAQISEFQSDINQLTKALANIKFQSSAQISDDEAAYYREILSEFMSISMSLFSEQHHINQNMQRLQIISIGFAINPKSVESHQRIIENLFLVKELVYYNNLFHEEEKNLFVNFYSNHNELLEVIEYRDCKDLFNIVVELLIDELELLKYASEERLILIYDNIKHISFVHSETFAKIIQSIHLESRLRYNAAKLSDDAYKLMTRFQMYDEILSSIEHAEKNIIESFLIHPKNFPSDLLSVISKNLGHLKAVGAYPSNIIISLVSKLENELSYNKKIYSQKLDIINNIKSNGGSFGLLSSSNKYDDLSSFVKNILQQKYLSLFQSAKDLLSDEHQQSRDLFVHRILSSQFSKDYYNNKYSNSVDGLRDTIRDRSIIENILLTIPIYKIFYKNNKINSITFKQAIDYNLVKNIKDYIDLLMQSIVKKCTTAQLECIYLSLHHDNLNEYEVLVKDIIKSETKSRLGVRKMVVSILSGKVKEYRKLKDMQYS